MGSGPVEHTYFHFFLTKRILIFFFHYQFSQILDTALFGSKKEWEHDQKKMSENEF